VRGAANPDHAFWSKPSDADAGWIDDLSATGASADDAYPLDTVGADRSEPTDRVFHELREIVPIAPDGVANGGDRDEPDDALPPAASATFDINVVNDDLLPSWDLDLG
jgi:hypothetical protein